MRTDHFILTLTAVFVALRLTGLVVWSWLWVLSPLWVGGVFVIMLAVYVTALHLALGLDREPS